MNKETIWTAIGIWILITLFEITPNMETFWIITTIGAIWFAGAIISEGLNREQRKKSMWRVVNNYPNKDLAGKIVKIIEEHRDRATVQLVTPITRKSRSQIGGGYYGMPGIGQLYETATQDYCERVIEFRNLRRIKSITEKKGGEKVRKMPRLFRFALYLALVVLVWDVVLNANSIVVFAFHTFILHK